MKGPVPRPEAFTHLHPAEHLQVVTRNKKPLIFRADLFHFSVLQPVTKEKLKRRGFDDGAEVSWIRLIRPNLQEAQGSTSRDEIEGLHSLVTNTEGKQTLDGRERVKVERIAERYLQGRDAKSVKVDQAAALKYLQAPQAAQIQAVQTGLAAAHQSEIPNAMGA